MISNPCLAPVGPIPSSRVKLLGAGVDGTTVPVRVKSTGTESANNSFKSKNHFNKIVPLNKTWLLPWLCVKLLNMTAQATALCVTRCMQWLTPSHNNSFFNFTYPLTCHGHDV
eukprot:1160190-Pelagomonas_calceolata.AAC.4